MEVPTPYGTRSDDVISVPNLLKRAGIVPGMTAADFGVGREGTFTLEAAKLVGSTGKVYALDIIQEVLNIVVGIAEARGFMNVRPVWTDLELYGAAVAVPSGTVDVGILANTLFQSVNHNAVIQECVRMMREGGRMLIVDWKPIDSVLGPPVKRRVRPQEIKAMLSAAGMVVLNEFNAGEYHWGMIAQK